MRSVTVVIPHCIMYEGICILYFPELAGLPVAVVGRNSYYLLFIAVALGDHGLSIELTLTTPHHTTTKIHNTDQICCCCRNQFFVFNLKQRENNGVVTMDPKGMELHTARQLQTKKIQLNLSSQQTRVV